MSIFDSCIKTRTTFTTPFKRTHFFRLLIILQKFRQCDVDVFLFWMKWTNRRRGKKTQIVSATFSECWFVESVTGEHQVHTKCRIHTERHSWAAVSERYSIQSVSRCMFVDQLRCVYTYTDGSNKNRNKQQTTTATAIQQWRTRNVCLLIDYTRVFRVWFLWDVQSLNVCC